MNGSVRLLATPFGRLAAAGWDFVYPPTCGFCGGSATANDGGTRRLCGGCKTILQPGIPHRCRRCSAPVGPHTGTAEGCPACRKDRFAFERAVSLGTYEQGLAQGVRMAKQPGGAMLATALADLLWDVQGADLSTAGVDLVVPVPHHWMQRLVHVHLPPVTVARGLARRLKAPLALHILAKVRRTPKQTSLTPTRRRANLRKAFGMAGGARLSGETVLLVDDVLTTGTTAHRSSQVLLQGGAGRVLVAVIARALGTVPGA